MSTGGSQPGERLLLFEPRTEGHHLGWLRFISEDLLSAGFRLSLAVDLRPQARPKLEDHLAGLLDQIELLPACDERGRPVGGSKLAAARSILAQSGAARVFLCALDEIASGCWRRAAFGWTPPAELRGRLGGIYHRPRFMAASPWQPGRWLKQWGFHRLLRGGWLCPLLFVDEYIARDRQAEFPGRPVFFLPDPCPSGFTGDAAAARRRLGVPLEKRVFLFYGTGARRKGLHLAVEAMRSLPADHRSLLLCVGAQNPRGRVAAGLGELARQGRAVLIDRYVSAAEEILSFVASDAVLLPYLNHFGASGVLSRAAAAGKMVIVSDEQLLGRLTRDNRLGLLFRPGDAGQLRERIAQTTAFGDPELDSFQERARHYAQRYSRGAYRAALLASLGCPARASLGP